MSDGFARQLRTATDPLWRAIHAHPFVVGIGDGTLPREPFAYYLAQDYVYLDGFSRVLAVGAAKAHDLETMRRFAELLHATLEGEMDLHRRTCAAFGITSEQLETTAPAMITSAYTSFLLRACHEGALEDVFAVLLPCAAGYVEIAKGLREAGLPDDPHYRDWIETYTDPAMVELVMGFADAGKLVAAICHAGWMLVSADIIRGRSVTSYFSIKDDLVNAGGKWVDEAVVVDGHLVTSRTPDDLPAFMRAIIGVLGG